MRIIVSSCCEAKLKFVAREPSTRFPATKFTKARRVLGKRVRAYVCQKCGKRDR